MAQLDRSLRRGESTPKTPSKPTMEQLLRDGEGSWWLSSSSSSSGSSPSCVKNHDPEEDHIHHQKKSVLSKVKEKARKLRHSLSAKKRHNEDGNTTPSWGVSLDDYEDEEEDAEYLGAPMYESELAPESYKETARQHPRAIPVISEKHALPETGSVNDNNKENPLSPNNKLTQTKSNDKPFSPTKTITETVSQKLTPALGTVTEKLGPAYASVAETTHSIASKIPGLTVSSTTEASRTKNSSSPLAPILTSSARTPPPQTFSAQLAPQPLSAHAAATPSQPFSGPVAPESTKHVSFSCGDQQVWDKGVSVKEYLLHKLEPGDDDRALSRAISEAISPKKTPGDMSVVDKVREAVSSLLRNDSLDRTPSKSAVTSPSKSAVASPSKSVRLTRSATKASSQIPISSNAREVKEEENHGRILQTN
ncbi:low-temperature-induced protein [Trema orientale]|uniref:Low-temperature-induced protein n=1 Tax=Trema orientale TaxID=63057 RepID=A0A2P5D6B2_TREOI|nr:low-temperature-induced protein [Trema orientale]